jgi:integrase
VIEYAVDMGLIESNPTRRIKNVRATADRRQILPFETWAQVEAITAELHPCYAAIPSSSRARGCDPEELWALEPRDVDLDNGVLNIERVHSQGVLKERRKSSRQRRVPLRQRVVEALRAQPPRLDSPLLFPAARGSYIDGEKFRYRHWKPALKATGIEHRRVYDCRHTFASWAIAGGVQLFYLARIMGTSVQQIDQTYGHLLPDSEEYLRGLLDNYDAATAADGAKRLPWG